MNCHSIYDSLDPTAVFRLHECVGHGNFGSVYKATDTLKNRIVAVKTIDLENSTDDIDMIIQEIYFLANLKNTFITEYIVSLLNDSHLWIIMEFCGGGSCSDLLRYYYRNGLAENKVSFIIFNVLQGLEYLHRQKIIHRDIKAANILLTLDGDIKIGDFGVSGQIKATAKKNTFVGTPFWMAPEIIANNVYHDGCHHQGYDEMADIWSLGITVMELVKGSPPYGRHDPMKVMVSIPKRKPPKLHGNYSHDIKNFISSCLQKNPMDRLPATDLLNHNFIMSYIGQLNNLKEDVDLCNEMKLRNPKYRELNKRFPYGGNNNEGLLPNDQSSSNKFVSWDFNMVGLHKRSKIQEQHRLHMGQTKRIQEETIASSPVSSNILNEKGDSCDHQKMTVTPLTIPNTPSLIKYPPSSPLLQPNRLIDDNIQCIQESQNKLAKYDLGSGMEIDTDSKSIQKPPEDVGVIEINYFEDVVCYSLRKMELRAHDDETKAYVGTLLQTFSAIENEVPGFSNVFMEEVMLRLEVLGNYIESHNCSRID